MKLVEANYAFMISKRRHLEFMANHILHKGKMALRDLINRIKENREIYSRGYDHMATRETIDGVELEITVTYDYSQSSEEILFCFFCIRTKRPYPTRLWENCTVDGILEHLQYYLNNVIVRKKIII